MKKKMKKLLAIVIVISLCLSCATINVGAGALPYKCFLGDVNGNGILTIEDVTSVQRYLAEMVTWKYIMRVLADYDHNDKVNVKDVTAIQRAIAELPQPESYGGYLRTDPYLIQKGYTNYLSGSMPAGTPVTVTVNSYQAETYVFCVNNVVVQPRSTKNTCTYTFYEPGYYDITAFAMKDTDSRVYDCCEINYMVPEDVSDTDLRINQLRISQATRTTSSYVASYGAAGGAAPYTYSLTLRPLQWWRVNDAEIFNAYAETHETDWQLRYNQLLGAYELYRDFSADETVTIEKEMLDCWECDHELRIQVKDAQGEVSAEKSDTLRAVNIAG